MKSTSSSNFIVKVSKLNFHYPVNIYNTGNSLKDLIISSITSPFTTLIKKKEYFHVLKDIDLTIESGDRIGVIGINGAGKTTLCRCIAGILKSDKGTIEKNGEVRSIFNTTVGIIPELTGRENAFLLAKFIYPNLKTTDITHLVNDAVKFSEIGTFVDVPYKNYSKGMQARLTLSVISARPTDLLILDEVLDGADQFFRKKIKKRMLNIITSSKALLFVSHDTNQIKEICNRIIIIDGNKIIFNGNVTKGIYIYNLLGEKKS